MTRKIIKIPDDIEIVNPLTNEPLGEKLRFKEFVINSLMLDPRWLRALIDVTAGAKVLEAVKTKNPGESFELDEQDFEKFKTVAEAPKDGYRGIHPAVMPQLLPFLKAIVEA